MRFRMLMIASGYEAGNGATALRSDPAFKLAQGVRPSAPDLASQSTISRLENLPDIRTLLRAAFRLHLGVLNLPRWTPSLPYERGDPGRGAPEA